VTNQTLVLKKQIRGTAICTSEFGPSFRQIGPWSSLAHDPTALLLSLFPSQHNATGPSARAFGLFGLLGPVFSVFTNFGHPEMLPKIPSVFSVFLYSVFGLFGPVFGHDHIDQIKKCDRCI
jgi:hypothetical protein